MIPTNQSAVFISTNESAPLCQRRRQVGQSSLPQNIKLNWIRMKNCSKDGPVLWNGGNYPFMNFFNVTNGLVSLQLQDDFVCYGHIHINPITNHNHNTNIVYQHLSIVKLWNSFSGSITFKVWRTQFTRSNSPSSECKSNNIYLCNDDLYP